MKMQKRYPRLAVIIGAIGALLAARSTVSAMFGAAGISRAITLGSLTLTSVYPRIFTPNGDGANDKAGFHFDNPELLPVSGSIFDITGAKVADMKPSASLPDSLLVWDGKDDGGKVVPGGIYLYQIVFQGKTATGTVVVVR